MTSLTPAAHRGYAETTLEMYGGCPAPSARFFAAITQSGPRPISTVGWTTGNTRPAQAGNTGGGSVQPRVTPGHPFKVAFPKLEMYGGHHA